MASQGFCATEHRATLHTCVVLHMGGIRYTDSLGLLRLNIILGQTEKSKQPMRTLYLDHVTGYQPIRDQYFLIQSVPVHDNSPIFVLQESNVPIFNKHYHE